MPIEASPFLSCMMSPCLICSLKVCEVMNAKLESNF
jgi:hypothetical protein